MLSPNYLYIDSTKGGPKTRDYMPLPKKILIIDDETDLCLLLKDYFTRKQYEVYVCNTLSEGERTLNDVHPDILFLDNNLPDGVGWNTAPEIAKKYPDLYIVLFSAFHPEIPAMPANAHFRIVEKPISLLDLEQQMPAIQM